MTSMSPTGWPVQEVSACPWTLHSGAGVLQVVWPSPVGGGESVSRHEGECLLRPTREARLQPLELESHVSGSEVQDIGGEDTVWPHDLKP